MKQRVFIGSSTESLKYAEIVKSQLEPLCNCEIWSDNTFFTLNKSTYQTLCMKLMLFDFAVFIGGKDDLTLRLSNLRKRFSTRDNVYLEAGLFAGAISPERTFFMFDRDCGMASDLNGITVVLYSNEKDIKIGCKMIEDYIKKEENISRIQLLPSTSLAIGYFENFLRPLVYGLQEENKKKGIIKFFIQRKRVKYDQIKIEILIPKEINSRWSSLRNSYFQERRIEERTIKCKGRNLSIAIDLDKTVKGKILHIVDLPISMDSAFIAIQMVLKKDYNGCTEQEQYMREKEVENFVKTLNNLLQENHDIGKCVFIE